MVQIPVYAFTGFLDSGKTKFIQETLEDERFNAGERTLLLVFEEGEEEYDVSTYPHKEVYEQVLDYDALSPALLTGLLAKESIISTLAVLAGQGSIRAALAASLPTPAAALALMTFVLLYPPCAAASASIIKGLKSRKLAVLMVTGQCLLAWICAWIAYRLPLV